MKTSEEILEEYKQADMKRRCDLYFMFIDLRFEFDKMDCKPDSCKTDTGKPPFKASEGGCFENLRVSEDITPSEFQQGKGTRVPIRPKVRLEASPNGLPMSVSSKVYATLRMTHHERRP